MKKCRCSVVLTIAIAFAGGCEHRAQGHEPQAAAGEFRSEDVDRSLAAADVVMRTRGYTPEWDVRRGFLVERDSEVIEISLAVDACYVATAAGSAAMDNIDLRIFSSGGSEAARDTTTGAQTAAAYCPPHPGVHYLAVQAESGTGLFGVQLFRGPSGLDMRLDDVFGDPARPPSDVEVR